MEASLFPYVVFQGVALVALPDLRARLALCHRSETHFIIIRIIGAGHRPFRLVLHCPVGLDRTIRLSISKGETICITSLTFRSVEMAF